MIPLHLTRILHLNTKQCTDGLFQAIRWIAQTYLVTLIGNRVFPKLPNLICLIDLKTTIRSLELKIFLCYK